SSSTKSLPAPCILVNRNAPAPGCGAAALIALFVTGGHGDRKRGLVLERVGGGLAVQRLVVERIRGVRRIGHFRGLGRQRHEQVGLVAAGGKREGGHQQRRQQQAGEFHAGSVAAAAAARNGSGGQVPPG